VSDYTGTITGSNNAGTAPSYVSPSSASCIGYSNADANANFGSSSPQPILPEGATATGVFEIQGFGSVVVVVAIVGSHPQNFFNSITLTKGGVPHTYNTNVASYANAGSTTNPTYTFGSSAVSVWVWNTGGNVFLNFANGVATNFDFNYSSPVPNVVGDSLFSATAAIIAAGYTLGTVTLANSLTIPAGIVLTQSPAAGSSPGLGTPVNLSLSLGPVAPAYLRSIKIDPYKFTVAIQFNYDQLGSL
jgi:PASTA domain